MTDVESKQQSPEVERASRLSAKDDVKEQAHQLKGRGDKPAADAKLDSEADVPAASGLLGGVSSMLHSVLPARLADKADALTSQLSSAAHQLSDSILRSDEKPIADKTDDATADKDTDKGDDLKAKAADKGADLKAKAAEVKEQLPSKEAAKAEIKQKLPSKQEVQAKAADAKEAIKEKLPSKAQAKAAVAAKTGVSEAKVDAASTNLLAQASQIAGNIKKGEFAKAKDQIAAALPSKAEVQAALPSVAAAKAALPAKLQPAADKAEAMLKKGATAKEADTDDGKQKLTSKPAPKDELKAKGADLKAKAAEVKEQLPSKEAAKEEIKQKLPTKQEVKQKATEAKEAIKEKLPSKEQAKEAVKPAKAAAPDSAAKPTLTQRAAGVVADAKAAVLNTSIASSIQEQGLVGAAKSTVGMGAAAAASAVGVGDKKIVHRKHRRGGRGHGARKFKTRAIPVHETETIADTLGDAAKQLQSVVVEKTDAAADSGLIKSIRGRASGLVGSVSSAVSNVQTSATGLVSGVTDRFGSKAAKPELSREKALPALGTPNTPGTDATGPMAVNAPDQSTLGDKAAFAAKQATWQTSRADGEKSSLKTTAGKALETAKDKIIDMKK